MTVFIVSRVCCSCQSDDHLCTYCRTGSESYLKVKRSMRIWPNCSEHWKWLWRNRNFKLTKIIGRVRFTINYPFYFPLNHDRLPMLGKPVLLPDDISIRYGSANKIIADWAFYHFKPSSQWLRRECPAQSLAARLAFINSAEVPHSIDGTLRAVVDPLLGCCSTRFSRNSYDCIFIH